MPNLVRLARDILREVESGDGRSTASSSNPARPETVRVDTKLTNHILSNLVGNARAIRRPDTTVTVKLHIDEAAFTLR